jgi:hypothetical protein
MPRRWWIIFIGVLAWPALSHSENLVKEVKQSVTRSTLDQPGTKPFHLKASIAPSFERDKDSGRTGVVEIWWASPTQWKREVSSPKFHQIEVLDGGRDWQKNEGDYFPEWLRQTAVELITPVPPLDRVLQEVKKAEVRRLGPMTNLSWTTTSGTLETPNIIRSTIAWLTNTGLLLYADGFGWGGEFKDCQEFHGLMIARVVNAGSPQVTAKVVTLEDLGNVPAGFFDTTGQGAASQPLQTVMLDEVSLRKNLLPAAAIVWPPLQDGSLQGNFTTQVVVDRNGVVRETGTEVSENGGVNDIGRQAAAAMRFKPFLVNGAPVQAVSQLTIPFKTVRPAGVETFASAQTFFERARRAGFPAAAGKPYLLRAEFAEKAISGTVAKGRYEDTWVSNTQWRREAWFAASHYVRSRNGDRTYQLAEGPNSSLLRLVFKVLEPIPAGDSFVESDWRIKGDSVNKVPGVRALSGYESPSGELDPEHARGYWFDSNGLLVKTYFNGIETQRSEFADFAGVAIARKIDVLKNGKVAMQISITEVNPAGPTQAQTFEVHGHEWTRAFTDEAR